ncbi:MAG: acetolactate synthase small subunit [Sphaerochaetaceae bacterium]|jgi:acetolactate synthase-1/3 small subunit
MENTIGNRYTLSILVYNRSGVLMRVVGLFSRRGYNIDSLSVGETQDESISRITIVVTGSREVVEQIKHQVEKLVDVINVAEMRQDASIQKELVLIKIATTEVTRTHIIELAEIFKAKVEDVASTAITLQITGSLDKIASFIDLAKEYGIVELVRTGITALGRGASSQMELGVVDE